MGTHSLFRRVKRIWYLPPMRAAKVQASLRIRAVSPEPPLLAHTSSESRGTFRQKTRSLVPMNGWACAVKFCHDGMLEVTNSLDAALLIITPYEWLQNKILNIGIITTVKQILNLIYNTNTYSFVLTKLSAILKGGMRVD